MGLWRVRATVDDRPGFLAVLAASLALRGVNILAVQVHTTEAGAVDDFLVDAPDSLAEKDLVAAVEKGRGRDPWVCPARVQGLVDPPTQALALATRVARDPEALGESLCLLLGGDRFVWRLAGDPPRPGFAPNAMRLPDPAGGVYEVSRRVPAFTPAEYARAQALVELAEGAIRGAAQPVLLAGGAELVLRPGGAEDLPELRAMHARCSPGTRRGRYLTGSAGPSTAALVRLLDPARATTLVLASPAEGTGETIVAMANLVMNRGPAEVALLVEDAWQRRGLGSALLRRLAALAVRAGHSALVAHVHADNAAMPRTLRRLGPTEQVGRDGPLVTLTVTLPNDRPAVPA